MPYAFHLVTDWKLYKVTGKDNIASASTFSGEYVSSGKPVMHTMLKLYIIIVTEDLLADRL